MTTSQEGGIKVLYYQTDRNVMDREIRSLDGIRPILNNTTNIEVVSTGSLNSFVFRLHLNRDPANILFRSNMLDTTTSRFTRESFSRKSLFSKKSISLGPDKAFNEAEGLPVHEIIMKVSIINLGIDSRGNPIQHRIPIQSFNSKDKASLSEEEFNNEYYTQRYLYSSMMSISGNPFCPDAFGLYVTRNPSDDIVLSLFQNIQTIASKNPRLQEIMNYLTRHLAANYRIGFIFMESIPTSYRAVFYLSLKNEPTYNENIYKKICEGICGINILTIYRGKIFHLDAHSGNWLCNPVEKLTEQVKEIDFGRVYRINTPINMSRFITELKKNVKQYFETFSKDVKVVIRSLNNFFYTMGAVNPQFTQYVNDQDIQRKITYAQSLLETEIRRMIDDFNENEYFSKPYMSLSKKEKIMNIKIIHRIILIYIYVDFFYNCSIYSMQQGQVAHIYNIIFETTILNINSISDLNLHIDLDEFSRANHDKAMMLLQAYKRIYTILYKFNEDKHFENIREYERFKEFHYTKAQRAWTKIKQLAGAFMECSLTKASICGISKCSSAVYGVVSSASSGVARASVDVAKYAANKSVSAFNRVRSSITGYKPPVIIVPKQRAESPKGYSSLPSAPAPISPLAYGGSQHHTKRVMRRKRHSRRGRRGRHGWHNYTKKK